MNNKSKVIFIVFVSILLFFSAYYEKVIFEHNSQHNLKIKNSETSASLYGLQENKTNLSQQTVPLNLKTYPKNAFIFLDNIKQNSPSNNKYERILHISPGKHILEVMAYGFRKYEAYFSTEDMKTIEVRLVRINSLFQYIGKTSTGNKPKSVAYFPDGQHFAAALLDGEGVEVFDALTLEKIALLSPPKEYAEKKGFVEILFNEKYNEIYFSQMSTGAVHIFDIKTFMYKQSLSSKGSWSKILCLSNDKENIAVSNWISENISIFSVEKKNSIKKIQVEGIPRGMLYSNDDKFLYVCIFSNGSVLKINMHNEKIEKLNLPFGSKRHIVMDRIKQRLYVSDMSRGSVFVIDALNDKLLKEIKVDRNINTIVLSAKREFLIVSSRGPNNSESYLLKGPQYGKIFAINTNTLEIVDWIWGKNQPTGLDCNIDTNIIAFSNFLDNDIEVYYLNSTF